MNVPMFALLTFGFKFDQVSVNLCEIHLPCFSRIIALYEIQSSIVEFTMNVQWMYK